jgi:hypothetical protein
VRAVTQYARRPEGRATMDDDVAQICLDESLVSRPPQLLSELVRKVGEVAREDFRPQKDERLDPRCWRMQLDHAGKPTGKIEVRFTSAQHVTNSQRLLAWQTVMVSGVITPLTVRSEALEAATFRRPGRRMHAQR